MVRPPTRTRTRKPTRTDLKQQTPGPRNLKDKLIQVKHWREIVSTHSKYKELTDNETSPYSIPEQSCHKSEDQM